MINRIKHLTRFDPISISALSNLLSSNRKLVRLINLFLNIAYKFKIKIKNVEDIQLPHQDFIANISQKNCDVFARSIVLIAELSIPQCKKYRVDQKVLMLEHLGFNVKVFAWGNSKEVCSSLQYSGTAIFYRVPAFDMVKQEYALARHLGVTTYFDVDDLIFDREKLAQNESLYHLPKDELEQLYNGADLYREALLLADYGIASTKCLADQMHLVTQKSVFVLHNAIDDKSLNVPKPISYTSGRCRIVYGSGTNTHNEDFAVASTAILRILNNFNNVDFVIYGYLDLDSRFDAFESQILKVPFVDASDYYRALASCNIAIAPLTKNLFNDCKSNIKFLESSLYKLPSVCSPLYEFADAIRHGQNGFLANTSDEWYDSLVNLIQNERLRLEIASNAYNDVISRYGWDYIAQHEMSLMFPRLINNRKRILLVNVLYKPDSFGGATIIVEESAKELKKQGFEILVFCGTLDQSLPFGSYQRYDVDGISVVKVRVAYHADKILEYNNQSNEDIFLNIVRGFNPDIVHFHSIQLLGANLANVCFSENIPYLITLHDAWWFCERQFMINKEGKYCNNEEGLLSKCASCVESSAFNHKRRYYLYDVCTKANKLLVPSNFQRELYISAGFNPEQILVNKNGVIPVIHNEVYKSVEVDKPLVFAYLGGMAEHKGFYWLDDIFANLYGNFELHVVDIESRMGAQMDYLKEFTKTSHDKIKIVSYFNQDSIDDFFSNIDVLLFPSQCKESFGLTIREVMLRDKWVVTTDCGGPSEDVVNGVNGNVVEFGNKQQFLSVVQDIVVNYDKYIQYFNQDKSEIRLISEQVNELINYYRDVMNESY